MMFRFLPAFFIVLLLFSCGHRADGEDIATAADTRIQQLGDEAYNFIRNNGYYEGFCVLIDMSIPAGKDRFFLYDPVNKRILDQGLTTHGTCNGPGKPAHEADSKYSNYPDSHCSSLGKYRIGNRDYSSWGINVKYWLHGLESSNNNAVRRVVVLHSWDAVPDFEMHPLSPPRSWGCPAVSNDFMRRLDERLQQVSQPVLLWIFE